MYYVYILQSIKYPRKIYIGSSRSVINRLKQHNKGLSKYTNRFRPWRLIYYEAFLSNDLAKIREYRLKNNGNSLIELKKRINLNELVLKYEKRK